MVHLSSRPALMTPADFNSIPCFPVFHNVPRHGAKLTAFPLTAGANLRHLCPVLLGCVITVQMVHMSFHIYLYVIPIYHSVGNETSHAPGRSVLVVLSVFPHSLLKVIFTGCINASHIVHPPVLIPVSLDVHI